MNDPKMQALMRKARGQDRGTWLSDASSDRQGSKRHKNDHANAKREPVADDPWGLDGLPLELQEMASVLQHQDVTSNDDDVDELHPEKLQDRASVLQGVESRHGDGDDDDDDDDAF